MRENLRHNLLRNFRERSSKDQNYFSFFFFHKIYLCHIKTNLCSQKKHIASSRVFISKGIKHHTKLNGRQSTRTYALIILMSAFKILDKKISLYSTIMKSLYILRNQTPHKVRARQSTRAFALYWVSDFKILDKNKIFVFH